MTIKIIGIIVLVAYVMLTWAVYLYARYVWCSDNAIPYTIKWKHLFKAPLTFPIVVLNVIVKNKY
jgi:hypothetical protein